MSPFQLWIVVTGGLAGAGLLLLGLGLFWDRAKGRRRCPKCWYSLAGIHGSEAAAETGGLAGPMSSGGFACPECGHKPKSERVCLRTRRHGGLLATGVALLLGGADSFFAMQRVDEGWTRWIPSTVLVWIVPASAPDLNTDLGVAINCRSYSLWSWQSGIVAARQLWFANEDDLRACIHTRPLWVEGAPIRFEARVPNKLTPCIGWWEVDVVSEAGPPLHVYSAQRAMRPPGVRSHGISEPAVPKSAVWPGLPVGDVEVPLTIRIEGPFGVSRSLQHTVRFSVVPADRRILTPFNDEELATIIKSSLYVSVKKGDEPSITIRTLPDEIWEKRAALPGTHRPAIGIQIEVCDGGRVVARFDQMAGEYSRWGQAGPLDALREIAVDRDGTFFKPELLARLVLRVRGDQGVSMKDLIATDYWSGEFTVPLADVMERPIPDGYQ